MAMRSSDGRGPAPPLQKRSRTSGGGSANSSRASTPVDHHPTAPTTARKPRLRIETDATQSCTTCGLNDAPDDLMQCCHCANAFHAKCAKLPSVPEDGAAFCRWSCFANAHKPAVLAQRGLSGDFPRLAAQIELLLRAHPTTALAQLAADAALPPRALQAPFYSNNNSNSSSSANGHSGSSNRHLPRPTGAADGSDNIGGSEPVGMYDREPHGHSHGGQGGRSSAESTSSRQARHGRNTPPSPSRASSSNYNSRVPSADALLDRRSASRTSNGSAAALDTNTGRRSASPRPFVSSGLAAAAPGFTTTAAATTAVDSTRVAGPHAAMHQQHHSSAHASVNNSGRSRNAYSDDSARVRRDPAAAASSSRYAGSHPQDLLPPGDPASNGSNRFASESGSGPSPPLPRSTLRAREADVPWLSASAFPASMLERFECHADNLNRVFRIDLTPAFADKTTHLYQSEIDFFFRCFESSDVSLVVKGMASELNPCMWTWAFLLESVDADACFAFDHFQYTRAGGRERSRASLEYAGELTLSLGEYSLYLDQFLASSSSSSSSSSSGALPPSEAIVLEDRATKETVTLVARDNVIALHSLVIAQSCAKLYSDLKNSFQWDVFAGGIHCLLQYVPERSRGARFSSPRLHFTFPGARGALSDPGNGTTDTAYQVLAGSLELVIFERMEPHDRDAFARILRRAGYHIERKPMLQEAHLRALSSAGFVWTTVKIHDGDFIHINKGRMHFWRAVARIAHPPARSGPMTEPCVFLSWEWVYQGVSQRGISTECWFAMKNASLSSGGWAFDPRRAIIEAAKTSVATVRSGQFLTARRSALAYTLSFSTSLLALDGSAVVQRQMQMVLFLESILQCLKTIVQDEYDLALAKDDTEAFSKRFDSDALWKAVDTDLITSISSNSSNSYGLDASAYACGVCGHELANIYKQCLGCTAYASVCPPNMRFALFRLCLRCHAHPSRHHFKPRLLHGYTGKLLSCEGHTGAPQSALDPNYFACACAPSLPCSYCGGCQSCSCVCHTQFQTRFRFASPESLDRLRFDVEEVVKFHKQVAAGAGAATR